MLLSSRSRSAPNWGDDQPIGGHAQLNLIAETTLLDERLGNSNAAGVADARKLNFHVAASCNYIVITKNRRVVKEATA